MSALIDPRLALKDLLNVTPVDVGEIAERNQATGKLLSPEEEKERDRRVQQFIDRYEPIRPVWADAPSVPTAQIVKHVSMVFGVAVNASNDAHPRAYEAINKMLAAIFNTPVTVDGQVRPTALDPDILAGTVTPVPRDLLDAMAIELMRSRKVIARCALCSKFFYRTFSKDKYCSMVCGSGARRKAQLEWVRTKRADEKKTSRKTRRKA